MSECEHSSQCFEWSKMNSLKINFISFILFLSVPRPTGCVEYSSVLAWSSVYCNPKSLSILPVQLYFLEYLKLLKYIRCVARVRESFSVETTREMRWGEMDFLRVSTPSKWNAINLWAEECFCARRNFKIANYFHPHRLCSSLAASLLSLEHPSHSLLSNSAHLRGLMNKIFQDFQHRFSFFC